MTLNLKNKKIIISAGASGIGWAITKECLKKGATVFLCDINKKFISKAKKHPLNNKKLFSYECDASDEIDVSKFFEEVIKFTFIVQNSSGLNTSISCSLSVNNLKATD